MTNSKKIKINYLEGMKLFIGNFMQCEDEDLVVEAGITSKALDEFIKKFKVAKDFKDEEMVFQSTLNRFMILLNKKIKQ